MEDKAMIVRFESIPLPTATTLRRWARMTDNNDHRKVRILIARHFNDSDRERYFREQAFERGGDGTIERYTNMQVYNDVTACMLRDIKEIFGEEVYRKVNSCL